MATERLRLRVPSASVLSSRSPARPPLLAIGRATATSGIALLSLVGLGVASGHMLLIPPMAASMALIAGAPAIPLSQPRNVVLGQAVSAVVGVVVGLVSHSLWAAAIAGGLALGAMQLFRAPHSPAAATAVIATGLTEGEVIFVTCTFVAAVVLIIFGWVRARLDSAAYPQYWW